MRHCVFASAVLDQRHLLAVGIRTTDGSGYNARRWNGSSGHYGAVGPLNRVVCELGGKPLVRAIGLGNDEKAGGVLVDAVDDARAGDTADARKLAAAMVEQGIDQSSVGIACSGMDDEPGGLVDHDQVLVLVDDVEWQVLGDGLGRRGFGHINQKWRAGRDLERGLRRRFAGQRDATFAYQRLDPFAGKPAGVGQRLVEAAACRSDLALDDVFVRPHCG